MKKKKIRCKYVFETNNKNAQFMAGETTIRVLTGKTLYYYNILFAQQPYFTFLLWTRMRAYVQNIVGTVADEVISVKNWTFTIYVYFDVLIIIHYTTWTPTHMMYIRVPLQIWDGLLEYAYVFILHLFVFDDGYVPPNNIFVGVFTRNIIV